jgi:hypothetical protein
MSLLKLIRKGSTHLQATATAATVATEPAGTMASVAKVARIAVAGDTMVSFVNTTVEGDWADIPVQWPGAIAVEADGLDQLHPAAAMTIVEETAVLAWLAYIHITDPITIDEVLDLCRVDGAVRADYVALAGEIPDPSDYSDERRLCSQCRNWMPDGRCAAAARGELNASRSYTPVPNQLQRCAGYFPGPDDPDQRTGRERRWPP